MRRSLTGSRLIVAGVDRLCFGTSTFVAGRLRPYKDSEPGMAALRAAVAVGVRLIHSNPKLGTQWAVRRVLDDVPGRDDVQHLVKAEVPLDARQGRVRDVVTSAIEQSCVHLGVDRLHAVVLQVDLKRTGAICDDPAELHAFYAIGADIVLSSGLVDTTLAYCHWPAQLRAALGVPSVAGIASQFHLGERWAEPLLDAVVASGKYYMGMSPLARGQLVRSDLQAPIGRLRSLYWALSRREVSAVAVTTSTVAHLAEVLQVAGVVAQQVSIVPTLSVTEPQHHGGMK